MKVTASLLFASRLLLPKTGKKSNARRSLIGAAACIAISLVPLVMVMAVSDGMIKGITERIIGLSSSHFECLLYSGSQEAKSAESLIEFSQKIARVEGVTKAYPEVQGVALAAGKNGRTGATVRSVLPDIFTVNPAFSSLFKVVEGNPAISGRSAVIGEKLAENLNLHAGSVFRLITTKQLPSGKTIPKITPFTVSAIVSSGYQELDALWVFIPLETGYSILPSSSRFIVGCETEDAFSPTLAYTQSHVQSICPDYTRIYTWKELNASQFENFSSTQIMLLFIMLLIVLVASVNISSALVMLVMERRREIAILKSLGGSAEGISLSFLITGMTTSLVGTISGLVAGLACAVNFNKIISFIEKTVNLLAKIVYLIFRGNADSMTEIHLLDPAFYLQEIPLSVPLGQLIIIACGTLVLSLVVSVLPSIKAGREKPIDTLRKM